MSLVPVRRGYWGNKIGKVHTVPTKITGKCGSVTIRLIPAPRGAGIVAARTPKKVLQMAGIEDCYTSSRGNRKTMGNFVKVSKQQYREGGSGQGKGRVSELNVTRDRHFYALISVLSHMLLCSDNLFMHPFRPRSTPWPSATASSRPTCGLRPSTPSRRCR